MIQAHSHLHSHAHGPSLLAPDMARLFGQGLHEEAPVTLRHLATPREIEAVLPLRNGIDLSAHASSGEAFRRLEKKETRWVLSALSNAQGA